MELPTAQLIIMRKVGSDISGLQPFLLASSSAAALYSSRITGETGIISSMQVSRSKPFLGLKSSERFLPMSFSQSASGGAPQGFSYHVPARDGAALFVLPNAVGA